MAVDNRGGDDGPPKSVAPPPSEVSVERSAAMQSSRVPSQEATAGNSGSDNSDGRAGMLYPNGGEYPDEDGFLGMPGSLRN